MERTSSNTPNSADEKGHNNVQDNVYIDPQEEKALLRKLDRWIVPPVMLLYLFSLVLSANNALDGSGRANAFAVRFTQYLAGVTYFHRNVDTNTPQTA